MRSQGRPLHLHLLPDLVKGPATDDPFQLYPAPDRAAFLGQSPLQPAAQFPFIDELPFIGQPVRKGVNQPALLIFDKGAGGASNGTGINRGKWIAGLQPEGFQIVAILEQGLPNLEDLQIVVLQNGQPQL